MRTVCEQDKCTGCMACMDVCPKGAITREDNLKVYNAIVGDKCMDCGACHQVCQKNHPAEALTPKCWYQGWAHEKYVRMEGSSGGVAMAIAKTFIEKGGEVCSCIFENGEFGFKIIGIVDELQQFAGSKYVKSNPKGIYRGISDKLKLGNQILFIGLPCQVSALRNFIGKKLAEKLYTVDLVCHGTPSPIILEIFLNQYNYSLKNIKDIQFRVKGKFQVTSHNKGIITPGVSDRYMISFLSSLTYTDNCYECNYAKKERVSDLTLGDSWGSKLPESEWRNGISLVLCQTEKGKELLEQADLCLKPVDLNEAIARNCQLKHPAIKPKEWSGFLEGLNKEKKFNYLVLKALPKLCLKQNVKQVLIRLKLLSR